ncbi:SpoVR family protein [Granulosicoccus sp. 3-233]|uniref:SpoVR family protein n=1 Tax=Granulosicoccus sp. 3-233 TaxID=3417969 RepID=UPI003D3272A0
MNSAQPLSQGPDWNFDLIEKYDLAIKEVAVGEFGLDCYPNQIEIIASEQMLDAYASSGLPISYPHWSFGKQFIIQEEAYRKGAQGLAYEIVINSDPCISYLMEENSMPLQGLVIAHACYGHNSFFKGNYLFRQWTNADAIVDYMVFAKNFVRRCEERHGIQAVEDMFDACHALRDYGVSRYQRPRQLSVAEELNRQREREEYEWKRHDEIWSTIPVAANDEPSEKPAGTVEEPQENLLYFLEKYSPKLAGWQREIIRIVRKMGQYFYPQGQTKVMNEGWATFWHYTILNRMYDKGLVDDGFMIEVLASHSNVIAQRGFDERGYGGFNPYALGFAMFMDIKRMCEHPTEEDRYWFPEIVDTPWQETLDFAMRNYKDESFIAQYLSPKLIREFHIFAIADQEEKEYLEIDSIHNEEGYRRVRRLLSEQYNRDGQYPDLQITGFDLNGDRSLTVQHRLHRNRPLSKESDIVLRHLQKLWGFDMHLETVKEDGTLTDKKTFAA